MPLSAGARRADTLLVHGKVLTLDGGSSVHEALAVRGGTIAAVGRSGEIRKLAGPGTRVIDLQGRPVIPGLFAGLFARLPPRRPSPSRSRARAGSSASSTASPSPASWTPAASPWPRATPCRCSRCGRTES